MTVKHRKVARPVVKKAAKKTTVARRAPGAPDGRKRVLHSTAPLTADEILRALRISKAEVKATLEAIDSAL